MFIAKSIETSLKWFKVAICLNWQEITRLKIVKRQYGNAMGTPTDILQYLGLLMTLDDA